MKGETRLIILTSLKKSQAKIPPPPARAISSSFSSKLYHLLIQAAPERDSQISLYDSLAITARRPQHYMHTGATATGAANYTLFAWIQGLACGSDVYMCLE